MPNELSRRVMASRDIKKRARHRESDISVRTCTVSSALSTNSALVPMVAVSVATVSTNASLLAHMVDMNTSSGQSISYTRRRDSDNSTIMMICRVSVTHRLCVPTRARSTLVVSAAPMLHSGRARLTGVATHRASAHCCAARHLACTFTYASFTGFVWHPTQLSMLHSIVISTGTDRSSAACSAAAFLPVGLVPTTAICNHTSALLRDSVGKPLTITDTSVPMTLAATVDKCRVFGAASPFCVRYSGFSSCSPRMPARAVLLPSSCTSDIVMSLPCDTARV